MAGGRDPRRCQAGGHRLRRPVVGSVMALRLSWRCPTWTG